MSGAIDGYHIEIKAPDDVQADYIDRNNRHSINILVVYDINKKLPILMPGFQDQSTIVGFTDVAQLAEQFSQIQVQLL